MGPDRIVIGALLFVSCLLRLFEARPP